MQPRRNLDFFSCLWRVLFAAGSSRYKLQTNAKFFNTQHANDSPSGPRSLSHCPPFSLSLSLTLCTRRVAQQLQLRLPLQRQLSNLNCLHEHSDGDHASLTAPNRAAQSSCGAIKDHGSRLGWPLFTTACLGINFCFVSLSLSPRSCFFFLYLCLCPSSL